MIEIKIDKLTAERLDILCKRTGRNKEYYAKKALKEFVEDQEDYRMAVDALKEGGEFISFEEVSKNLGLDN